MGFSYNVNVLNQKGSPALYTDTFANRPNFGYAGRLFIANDTSAIYEDTGTAWVLIANVSSGAGTLQQVTTNGNTSNVGISVTAGGVSTNSLTDTALTLGSVPFTGAGGLISQDNANFFWDDTNNRLGINTNTPGNSLDVHGSGTNPILALNNTAGNQSAISFLNTSVAKWRIGNTAINSFDIYNFTLAAYAMTISNASNAVEMSGTLNANEFNLQPNGYSLLASLSRNLTGAGYGVLTLRNSANGTIQPSALTVDRTYTLPDATGTLALTSNLSAYLPLTGGTLTTSSTNAVLTVENSGIYGSWIDYKATSAGGKRWIVQSTGVSAAEGVGKLVFNNATDAITAMVINSNGNIGIGNNGFSTQKFYITSLGTTTATTALRIEDGATSAIFTVRDDGSLTIPKYANGTLSVLGTIIISTSDINLKNDDGAIVNAIDKVLKLNPRYFYWKEESEIKSNERQLGFYAQEVKEALGEEVANNNNNKKWGIHDRGLIAMLTKANQEQQTIIESLKNRIELLENK